MENKILERVIEVLEGFAKFNQDSITIESKLADELGIQSIQIIDLIFELEDEFGIEFSDGAVMMENFKTVGTVVEAVKAKLNA